MKHTVLAQARDVVEQVNEYAKEQGFPLVSGTTLEAKSMKELIQASEEKKPLHLHGWVSPDGEYHISGLWAFEGEGPRFVSLFAKAD